jgi:hypothetical protein
MCRILFYSVLWVLCSFRCIATDVLTYHNDNARTGWNPNEIILTPANVNPNAFGLIFNLVVDGKVDAQPLYVSNAPVYKGGVSQGNHNLVIVATEHDSLYAFDADNGFLYWQSVLLGSGETPSDPRNCDQVVPEIGITATPVIDRNKGVHGTIYVVAMSKTSSMTGTVYHQRFCGIDLATGQHVPGSPVDIQASYTGNGPTNDGNGHVLFDPGAYKERCGLLLLNGIVYTSWASHCDIAPYTSWIIGYDETSLQQVRVLNLDPNGAAASSFLPDGSGNAFWNSGAGPAADANGFIYALTANGPFETTLTANGFPNMGDFGDTFLKLSTMGPLSVSDYFTPFDQAIAAANDTDLGSGGVVVLPDMIDQNGVTRHLAIGAGKDTNIYLVDRDRMGKFNPASNSNIYQELAGALPGGEWATAAYFNGSVYFGPVSGPLQKFTFTQALLDSTPAAMTSTVFNYPGVTPSVSSSGANAAIVWAYENPNGGGPAVLHAYNASDLTELYNSNQRPGRDQFGLSNKFITPTICNGKVFVGTTNSVGVFGLLNPPSPSPSPSPSPTPSPNPSPSPNPNPSPTLSSSSFLGYSGDFNGDGKQDILWRNTQTGEVDIWFMNGASVVSKVNVATVGLNWKIVGIADFNGDGQSDILWQNTIDGSFVIWTMHGSTHSDYGFPSQGNQWSITGAADLDHSGFADILWRNTATGEVVGWKSSPGLNFSGFHIGTASLDWNLVGAADLLGNGQSALIWRNQNSGEVVAWQLSGGAISAESVLGVTDLSWTSAGFGDFNGNGHQDILWHNTSNGSVAAWYMNGFSVSPAWINQGSISQDWQIRATPDVVGNGFNSILWSNVNTGEEVIWIPGGGGFSQASIGFAAPPWEVQR